MNPEDRLAIHEVLARSVHGLDERKPEMIEACFTPDASFELVITGAEPIPAFEGREAIMQLMVDSMNAHSEDRRHVISNIFIETATPDQASVVSTLAAFQAEDGRIQVMTSGVYRDELKKTAAGWQIERRHLSLDVPF